MEGHAPAQLSESDEAVEQRWESLDEAELNTEIEAYRTSLRAIRNSLQEIGISPDWEPDHDHLALSQQGNDYNGAGEEGDADLRCSSTLHHAHYTASVLPSINELGCYVDWALSMIWTLANGMFLRIVFLYMPMSPHTTGDPLLKPPSSML